MKEKAVIFYCNWTSFPGLQLSQSALGENNSGQQLLVSMCSGRLTPEIILQAFDKGAWGVMVTACPPEKCEHDANYKTLARVSLLKTLIHQMGIESNRLQFEWVDKGEAGKLKNVVDTFVDEIKQLGPLN